MTIGRVTPSADLIYTDDIEERIADLENEAIEAWEQETGRDSADGLPDGFWAGDWLDEADAEDYRDLKELEDELGSVIADGETLIADWYFEDYAEQLAENIGAIDRNASWPATCIDWEAAAAALRMDYWSVEYGGATFWVRS